MIHFEILCIDFASQKAVIPYQYIQILPTNGIHRSTVTSNQSLQAQNTTTCRNKKKRYQLSQNVIKKIIQYTDNVR